MSNDWLEWAVPLAAAGVSAFSPRWGAPAVSLGLGAYNTIQRNQEGRRYKDYLSAKLASDQAGQEDLARGILSAAGVVTDQAGQPAPDIPQGRSYMDVVGGRSPMSVESPIGPRYPDANTRDTNAATMADVPQSQQPDRRKAAEVAASLARAGDTAGARQLLEADMKNAELLSPEELARQFQMLPFQPGMGAQGQARGGVTVSRTMQQPTQRSRTDQELFLEDPKAYRAMIDARNASEAANRPRQTGIYHEGEPYEELDDNGQPTGNLVYRRTNTQTGATTTEKVRGRKAKAGGAAAAGGGALAQMLAGGEAPGGGKVYGDAKNVKEGATAISKDGKTKLVARGGKWVELKT